MGIGHFSNNSTIKFQGSEHSAIVSVTRNAGAGISTGTGIITSASNSVSIISGRMSFTITTSNIGLGVEAGFIFDSIEVPIFNLFHQYN